MARGPRSGRRAGGAGRRRGGRCSTGRERPIVLAPRRARARAVAAAVAPRSADLGVMLPYSPLHHLLLRRRRGAAGHDERATSPTSPSPTATRTRSSGWPASPTCSSSTTARSTCAPTTRCCAPRGERTVVLRRSRGYVPAALPLPVPAARPVLACGAELKSTFCVARGGRAWVGPHVGDLRNYETLRSFTEGIAHLERLFAVAPGGGRPRPAPRLPLDALRARARGRRAPRRAAPPRAPGGVPGRARRDRPGGRGDLRRHRPTDRTARPGAASCSSETCAGFERVGHLRAARLPGGDRAVARALADGLRVAGRRRPGRSRPCRRRWPAR